MAVTQINGTTQIKDATVTPAKVTSGVVVAAGTNGPTAAGFTIGAADCICGRLSPR